MINYRALFSAVLCGSLLCACTPTVKIEAPDKPIEINMNIKIEQEVRIRVEKDLDAEMLNNPDLFGVSK
ncbi:MAG: YnbE family lipoprotein [Alphaproteobacteria bacterium]|nr:YnbE family lipoprotein [Alphaproteobacteria bacterium]OIN87887.1 MAG: hypothetical protein AUJ12_00260 [Alphaproteobacteria bacterium CG1_02_46_17]